MSLDPYDFMRLVTVALATVWTLRGSLRTWRFLRRWEARLDDWGVSRAHLRRALMVMIARITILDPVNLGLILALGGIWTYRWAL